jgi:hypothetical protein
LGEEAVLGVAIKVFLEGFAGDSKVEAALGPRFGEAGDGVIVGVVFVIQGFGEVLAFAGVEGGEGDEGAEFALEVHGLGRLRVESLGLVRSWFWPWFGVKKGYCKGLRSDCGVLARHWRGWVAESRGFEN